MFSKYFGNGPVVCFIDDDQDELDRFESAMKTDFRCITGLGYEECRRKLKEQKLKPALWVLDLYFPTPGHVNTPEERATMNDKYAELEAKTAEFRSFLHELRQGPDGGIELLRKCRTNHRIPVVMFTRKGTLDDATRCLDEHAAAVLKKPMAASWSSDLAPYEKKKSLDEAMNHNRHYLTDKLNTVLAAHGFWAKNKPILTFLAGAVASAAVGWLFGLVSFSNVTSTP